MWISCSRWLWELLRGISQLQEPKGHPSTADLPGLPGTAPLYGFEDTSAPDVLAQMYDTNLKAKSQIPLESGCLALRACWRCVFFKIAYVLPSPCPSAPWRTSLWAYAKHGSVLLSCVPQDWDKRQFQKIRCFSEFIYTRSKYPGWCSLWNEGKSVQVCAAEGRCFAPISACGCQRRC